MKVYFCLFRGSTLTPPFEEGPLTLSFHRLLIFVPLVNLTDDPYFLAATGKTCKQRSTTES